MSTEFTVNGKRIGFDIYCPTFSFYFVGWRLVVSRLPMIGKLFRKRLRKEKTRVIYCVGDQIICSLENYEFIRKNGLSELELPETVDNTLFKG